MNKDSSAAPICELCGYPMKLVHTIPKVGGPPQLNVYRCVSCSILQTLEVRTDGTLKPLVLQ